MKKHLKIRISGKVQGVSFRDSTTAVANQLGIAGFVRTKPDGTVYIEAEGTSPDMSQFLSWCHAGPERAKVERVETEESGQLQGFTDFVVPEKGILGSKY